MNSKKIAAISLAAAMMVSAAAGCGNGNGKNGDASENGANNSGDAVTLDYYYWSDEEAYISKVVDSFNESNSKIQIRKNSVPNDDYDDKLKVLLSGGADVDAMGVRGTAQIVQYREKDALVDLTDKIKSSDLDVTNYGPMFNTVTLDDRHFALPTRSTCWAMVYNPDLFDAAGLDYPGQLTWSEYSELAKQLTVEDGLNTQWGGYWVPWCYHFSAIQNGVYVNDDDLTKVQESIEFLNKLYNVDQSHMSYEEMNATNSNWISEFENGNIAMMPMGEWFVGMIKADEEAGKSDVNWEIAPMPVPDGVEANTTWGQFEFAAINSKSKQQDAAFEFLTYLCGAQGSEIYAQNGMIHAYSTEETANAYKESVGKESVSVFFDAKKVQEQPVDVYYGEVLEAFKEHAELYFIGEKTIEETMSNFVAQRASIIK